MSRTKRILIIDDEEDFHSLFSKLLTAEGYEAISVFSGEEALQRLISERFDLIILDLVLPKPGMSGIETLEAIRRINTDTCVLITSAHATLEQAVEAVTEKGAQAYLQKPFKFENIRQMVRSGLKWRPDSVLNPDPQVNLAIELRRKGIMKRCFLTGSPYCPWPIEEADKMVFVGMPFIDKSHISYSQVYLKAIKPAILGLGLIAWRADESMNNVAIMCKICRGIQTSRYAIIDITDWNSNVMFEYGLACGLGKRAILLKNKMSDVPSDLRGLEYISYSDSYEDLKIKIVDHLGKLVTKSFPQNTRS